ncbi:cobalamin-binding protein [Desulfofundulus sp. TPOSR]|uniref:cobalamin B12-binding domain-containing protein n=1 Tax=Desulfofundulus sp. TPOSR TaxID=2714340 RepID=UPI00140977A3|nr:corrinoid protein [Desulfofundulus sp. TPOSR]NHM28341.1 cobalamin-binding protein [Desulfofundulus sp. TPOSR]
MSILEQIKEVTIAGDAVKAEELARQAVNEGIAPGEIIQDGFIAAMTVVGEKFKNQEIFVPEMLRAARAMQAGLKVIKPLVVGGEIKNLARVVLGTVKGDLHDIGKNLVGMMMEGAGIEVIDLGIDVPEEKFVEAVKTYQPHILAMSALLTTTMPAMRSTIEALERAGLRSNVKVLIGGAPVSQKFADEIGADGYAANAGEAVDKVKELLQ